MPGMMMKEKKPMSYKKGGMVKQPMHKMPGGKMMPGAKHGAAPKMGKSMAKAKK
jgi:hypothetical protein